jgi:hypothetical protein
MSRIYPTDIVKQTKAVIEAWKKIDPNFKAGDLTPDVLAATLAQVDPILTQMSALNAQMTDQRNQRDDVYSTLWQYLKTVRTSVKGQYGDNSSQYEMVGGTRMSERKPGGRKPKAQPTS